MTPAQSVETLLRESTEVLDTLEKLRADLSEEDAELHAQRIAVLDIEIDRLSSALQSIPEPLLDEGLDGERKFSRRLKDYRSWEPTKIAPEDAGREIEFAFGDGWLLGFDAALSIPRLEAGRVTISTELLLFLNGQGPLDGRWFGEGPPQGERGNFWWRKYLPAMSSTSAPDGEDR